MLGDSQCSTVRSLGNGRLHCPTRKISKDTQKWLRAQERSCAELTILLRLCQSKKRTNCVGNKILDAKNFECHLLSFPLCGTMMRAGVRR